MLQRNLIRSALVISLLSSCQSQKFVEDGLRSPATAPEEVLMQQKLHDLYILENQQSELLVQKNYLQKKGAQKSSEYKKIQDQMETNEESLKNLSTEDQFPLIKNLPTTVSSEWSDIHSAFERNRKENFRLHSLRFYENVDQPRKFELFFAGDEQIKLNLDNRLETWDDPTDNVKKVKAPQYTPGPHSTPVAQKYLKAQWSCYGVDADEGYRNFNWYDQGQNGQRVSFKVKRNDLPCLLKFKEDSSKSSWHALQFVAADERSVIKEFENQTESCFLPSQDLSNSLDQLFLTAKFRSMSCPQKLNSLVSLANARSAFQEKVKSLLGQELPNSFIDQKNPFASIDFSKAPKLDIIAASYLVFRSDFYGQTLKRLMQYHADRGAYVRILTSDVITLAKDRQMLMDFAATYPRVKVSFYEYDTRPGLSFKDLLNELHRTNHIKVLATYSRTQETANRVILGGRNVHDGFLFETNPGHTDPKLITYDKDESFTFWEDYDVLIQDRTFTQKMMAQYMSLWNHDQKSFFTRSSSQSIALQKPLDPSLTDPEAKESYVRHFISYPFVDNMSLETLFIQMIDNAKEEILITSPYFSPTPRIGEAFERAVDRGVDIKVVTRLNLDRDTADIILSDINKKSVNKFLGKIKMFEFTTEGKILHRKLFIVDRNISIVGSVNLNQRSFFHDFENALVVRSQAYNQQMRDLVSLALMESKEITEKQKIAFWKKIIIGLFKKEF